MPNRLPLLCLILSALAAPTLAQPPQTPPAATAAAVAPTPSTGPTRWESSIARFEANDKKNPPPQNAVLFIGSSSIAKWKTLKQDFPDVPVLNRGFGGSVIADSTYFADRIVVPYHPRRIMLYAGDNDLAEGRSPEEIVTDTTAFVNKVRASLPDVPIVIISIKPSPSRARLMPKLVEANRSLATYCAQGKDVTFVDVATPMLGPDGKPPLDLFVGDKLHMTPKGYAIWAKLLAPYVK